MTTMVFAHQVEFYLKDIIEAKCNYHICDQELLTIIFCFAYWWLELEYTEFSIQILTHQQYLKTFIESKKLISLQAIYLDILFEFNFQIISRLINIMIKLMFLTVYSMIKISKSK